MQNDGNGPRPLAYFSRKMSAAEQKYTTREQELLAIRDALKHWKHYLLGVSFTIQSDHESLKYLFSQKELSGRLLRWCDFLQQFDFGDVQYLPGTKNPVGDALSRPPEESCPAGTRANLEVELHVAEQFDVLYNFTMSSPASHLQESLRDWLKKDKFFRRTARTLKSQKFDADTHKFRNRYSMHDGLLYWNDNHSARLYVPQKMRRVLLRECHDTAIMGHMGVDRTYNL
jgi:hypothetical protein